MLALPFTLSKFLIRKSPLIILAISLFWAGLTYSFWQHNQSLKAQLTTLSEQKRALAKQLIVEQQAWRDWEVRHKKARGETSARKTRLGKIIATPSVKPTANKPIAPVLKHALNELRKAKKKEINDDQ